MTAAERALQRIREEMTERKLSQRDLADELKCSQSRVAKILNGGVNLRVNDLATLAAAVRITLTETVRDRGLEFYAEMTPTELRLLERIRQRPEVLEALLVILSIPHIGLPQPRVSKRRGRGRPLKLEPGLKRT